MTERDFEWVANVIGLWDEEREALRLATVEVLDVQTIARRLEIKPDAVRELLEHARARVGSYRWPEETRIGAVDLLKIMRGPQRPDPQAPALRLSEYTGEYVEAVLRSPYPAPDDFDPLGAPSDTQGILRREARAAAKKRERKARKK